MSSRHTLTRQQTVMVIDLLKEHCRKEGDRAIWDDGWDDDRITKEAEANNPDPDKPIAITSVRNWRRDLFGNIRAPNGTGQRPRVTTDMVDKVQQLHEQGLTQQREIRNMEAALEKLRRDWRHDFDELRKRVDGLQEWMNRIANFLQKSRVSTYKAPDGRPISTPPDEEAHP